MQANRFFRSEFLLLAVLLILSWMAMQGFYMLNDIDWLGNSDAGEYWSASQNLGKYSNFVMPAYPLMIRGFSILLGNHPLLIMHGLSLTAYLFASLMILVILKDIRIELALSFTLFFAWFPFFGLSMIPIPRGNSLLYLFVIWAVLSYLRDNKWQFLTSLIIATLFHKALWFPVGLLTVIALYERKIVWWQGILVFIPLMTYTLLGAGYHNDLGWIVKGNIEEHVETAEVPVFAGIVGNLTSDSIFDVLLGIMLIAYLLVVSFLFYARDWVQHHWLLALIVPSLLLSIILNEYEALVTITYTLYIVMPFAVYFDNHQAVWARNKTFWAVVLLLCFLSQFVFAWHVGEVLS